MNKRAYSEYVFWSKPATFSGLSIAQALTKSRKVLKFLFPELSDSLVFNYGAMPVLTWQMENKVRCGQCLHIFFTGECMADWLRSCATGITDEQVSILRRFNTQPDATLGWGGATLDSTFILHFKGGNSPVVLCRFVEGANIPHPDGSVSSGWHLFFKHGNTPVLYGTHEGRSMGDCSIGKSCLELVSSAIAYMQCFPESVSEGIPDDLKNINHFKTAKRWLSVATHASLIMRSGASPHYRSGHFRVLSSPRYTNMRGQTIFVHGVFVNGQSKTVLSPEDFDSIGTTK